MSHKRENIGILAAQPAHAKLKPFFRAAMKADGVLELLIYEDIGEDWWTGGGVTAKTVRQKIDEAGAFNKIALRINSPGGDAFEGVAIYNVLRAQGRPVDVFVDGIAASAASTVAMAGDAITMGVGSMMMVHNAWSVCVGDGDDMRKMGETLDMVSQTIGQIYVMRTGQDAAAIKSIMDEETWMGADECVEKGFATAIASSDDGGEAAMALAASFRSLAKLKNVPEKLRTARADEADGDGPCDCPCAPCRAGNCADCDCDGCGAENCGAEDCPCLEENGAENKSNLSQYEARLKLLRAS